MNEIVSVISVVIVLAHMGYSNQCCENKHCHPVPCNEIVDTGNGWKWDGREFTRSMLHVSEDGACHVCIAAAPLCIYLPSGA